MAMATTPRATITARIRTAIRCAAKEILVFKVQFLMDMNPTPSCRCQQ